MKNYMKDERGELSMIMALFIAAVATCIAAGAFPMKGEPDMSKLKNGQAEYTFNQ